MFSGWIAVVHLHTADLFLGCTHYIVSFGFTTYLFTRPHCTWLGWVSEWVFHLLYQLDCAKTSFMALICEFFVGFFVMTFYNNQGRTTLFYISRCARVNFFQQDFVLFLWRNNPSKFSFFSVRQASNLGYWQEKKQTRLIQ